MRLCARDFFERGAGRALGRAASISRIVEKVELVDFSQLRILMVENNHHVRRLMREMLLAFGARDIMESEDAMDAYSLMLSQRVDVVILDFFLGRLDGGDFARMVRWDPSCINRTTPILLVTGLPEHYRIAKARDAGINAILAKPVAPRDLYMRLHDMLENPRPFVISKDYVGPCRRHDVQARDSRKPASENRATLPSQIIWDTDGLPDRNFG